MAVQMHIYETPFYYIDYCLAQTAALQFLLASRKDYDDAFHRYVRFLSQGGEKVFTELLPGGWTALSLSGGGASDRGPGERGTAERIGACALPRNEVSGARLGDKWRKTDRRRIAGGPSFMHDCP